MFSSDMLYILNFSRDYIQLWDLILSLDNLKFTCEFMGKIEFRYCVIGA